MKKTLAVISAVVLTVSSLNLAAQTTGTKTSTGKGKKGPTLQEMSERLEKLEQEMAQMQAQLSARDKQLADLTKKTATAQAEVEMAGQRDRARNEQTLESVAKTNEAVETVTASVTEVKQQQDALAAAIVVNQQNTQEPKTLHLAGVDLKPGGFVAAETVSRQRATSSDVNTPFNSIPFAGQTAGRLSEFNGSGRQSRVSLLTEGRINGASLRGYVETDFLSAAVTSNSNESNSYSLRLRQAWAQAALDNGWTLTGGQMWSLATEYKTGLTNLQEALPMTIDAQYNVGFTWARQYAFRVVKQVNDRFWAGVSVEQAQSLNIGGHNLPAIIYQQPGNTSGLYNSGANYSYNQAPDLLGKVVYEPSFGHFEVYGVGRFFRARVFPNAVSLNGGTVTNPTAGAYTSKAQGGALGVNARVHLLEKRLDLGVHALAGDGIGRYSSSTLAEATEHPNGSLELLSGGSVLGSVEYHATPKLDLYGYYGGEYVKRAYYPTGLFFTSGVQAGQPVLSGYGAPTNIVAGCNTEVAPVNSPNGGGYVPGAATNCVADNRNVQEGTFGYWYRFYKGNHGTLQQGFQYSYAVRHTWLGIGDLNTGLGYSPKAIENMWFTSFRFYLP